MNYRRVACIFDIVQQLDYRSIYSRLRLHIYDIDWIIGRLMQILI